MKPTVPGEDVIKGMWIGILLVVEDLKKPLLVSYNDVAIVIEERIVMRHLGDVPNAFVNVMGLLYMLNLDYPKDLKYNFDVNQRLFMGIGSEMCTPRVHSLKNKLLSSRDGSRGCLCIWLCWLFYSNQHSFPSLYGICLADLTDQLHAS